MCGIAGFSLVEGSKVNARKLSNSLLCGIEKRGNQASGFAWQSGRDSGVFKGAVAGSRLSLRSLPKRASSVILHTRYATHGSVGVSANNHPVMSPDNNIALVHNGVIYNHDVIRGELPQFKLPEVDTSVIPAILQAHGVERFDMLDGDAAVAWLRDDDMHTLRVGRVSHSPLWVAQLVDGSFVFASTEGILLDACKRVREVPEFVFEVPERVLLTVKRGVIVEQSELPVLDVKYEQVRSYASTSKYRGMTAGGWGNVTPVDSYWDVSPGQEEFEDELAVWLRQNYFAHDGFWFDYAGTLLGDYAYMRELFEDVRYESYWQSAQRDRSHSSRVWFDEFS
jgi:asparagine synthetase B (glutamine-hydrolysing)